MADGQFDAYMYFNASAKGNRLSGVKMGGETSDKYLTGKFKPAPIELASFSFGFSIDPTWIKKEQFARNNMVPRPRFDQLTITKTVDTSSPGFFQSLCLAGVHNEAVILQRRGGGDKATGGDIFLSFALKHVVVTKVEWDSGEKATPTETVTMKFDGIEIEYQPQESSGGHSKGKAKSASWTVAPDSDGDEDLGLSSLFDGG